MKPCAIQPFYFPTTALFVDDSADFLANLSLQLEPRLAFRLFQSPYEALLALNGPAAAPPLIEDLFSLYRQREEASCAHHVIGLRLDMIHREVHNERRFEQVAVAVIDYGMPEIDGLEFCRNIRNPAVKKILLTGKADESLAVKAFNQGIIDRFVRKQETDVMAQLNRAIGDLQQAYFLQVERTLADALAVGTHAFLRDPAFAGRFREIRERLGIVEYYLACMPDGMLMLDAAGTPWLLIVQTADMMRANCEIASDQTAPTELLDALRGGKAVPYFWRTQGDYSPSYEDWRACLHPATEFRGDDRYLYALVRNPAGFDREHVVSYGDYLDRLDAAGRSP